MKRLIIGASAAGLLIATGAIAQSSSSSSSGQSPMGQSPSSQSSQSSTATDKSSSTATQSPSSQSSASTTTTSPSGSSATASSEISGVVKKVDKDKRQVKISSPTGGDQELKLADSATITKEDGSSASLDQLKEGTSVRASFDPSSNQATKLEIQSSAAGSKTDSSDMKSKSDTSSDTKSKSDSSSKKY